MPHISHRLVSLPMLVNELFHFGVIIELIQMTHGCRLHKSHSGTIRHLHFAPWTAGMHVSSLYNRTGFRPDPPHSSLFSRLMVKGKRSPLYLIGVNVGRFGHRDRVKLLIRGFSMTQVYMLAT